MIETVAKKILWVAIIFAFIFIIGYALLMGLYYYTSAPAFSSSCHYVEPYVASWSISPHQEVNCLECHEPTGSLGKLHSQARGLNYYISDKSGNYILPIYDASYINERNCAVMEAPIDPEIMEDQFAYRIIINGIQNSVDLHVRAVAETVRNDNLRAVFSEVKIFFQIPITKSFWQNQRPAPPCTEI